ncbi:hypothetical protein JTE90_026978 [Oedothorax gibbosus]|uniref:Uncharacterized protein n=1 Tax=Oedothorax gibbosus TaxID=931172 RepID=A0AAV6U2F4_9ARAC|nr:hypothetical protein JTE90_026978 [Oedothorax gibbosus]
MEGLVFRIFCLVALFCSSMAAKKKPDKEPSIKDSLEAILGNPDHPDFISVSWNNSDYKVTEANEQMMKKMMAMVIRQSSEIELSGPCMSALFKLMQAMRKQKLWATKRKYHIIYT